MSRRSAWFLIVAGMFNIVVWPRFAIAVVQDERAWADVAWASEPTSFFWVHAVLITTAVVIALGVLWVGVRGHRSAPR